MSRSLKSWWRHVLIPLPTCLCMNSLHRVQIAYCYMYLSKKNSLMARAINTQFTPLGAGNVVCLQSICHKGPSTSFSGNGLWAFGPGDEISCRKTNKKFKLCDCPRGDTISALHCCVASGGLTWAKWVTMVNLGKVSDDGSTCLR